MQIETYEVQEAEKIENEEEYLELTKELGLEGMSNILSQEGIIPFQRMDTQQRKIWSAFCPYKSDMKEYRGIIPLRILGLAKVCKENEYFTRMEVWSESETNPDPILVGIIAENNWSVNAIYLIGRWGEALTDWNDIVNSAIEKVERKIKQQIINAKSEIEVIEKNIKEKAKANLLDGKDIYITIRID